MLKNVYSILSNITVIRVWVYFLRCWKILLYFIIIIWSVYPISRSIYRKDNCLYRNSNSTIGKSNGTFVFLRGRKCLSPRQQYNENYSQRAECLSKYYYNSGGANDSINKYIYGKTDGNFAPNKIHLILFVLRIMLIELKTLPVYKTPLKK